MAETYFVISNDSSTGTSNLVWTNKDTYYEGEDIVVSFDYDVVEDNDWIAIWLVEDEAADTWPLVWLHTCGTQTCDFNVGQGSVTFGYGDPNETYITTFPLFPGFYKAGIGCFESQPYMIVAETRSFQII